MYRSVLNPTPSRLTSPASARSSARTSTFEHEELAQIYVQRGVEPVLARQVAQQLMAKDALGAHARDELGISEISTARPIQAALTSAVTFAVGAALPLLMVVVTPTRFLVAAVSVASLIFLALLGAIGARHRRCRCRQSDGTRNVLGCLGDGINGWRRRRFWHGGVNAENNDVCTLS